MCASLILAVYDRIVATCAAIVGILILSTVLLVTADVAGRYFFAEPIEWALELTEYFLLCVPFLGMAWLIRRAEGHVRIDLLLDALPPRGQMALNLTSSILATLTCGFAAYFAIETTLDHYNRSVLTYGIYPIPKFVPISVIAIGLVLATIEFMRKAIEEAQLSSASRT